MSPINRAIHRRLSFMAGSSLAAASILAFGSVAIMPSAALAANECGNPSANGAAADVLTCTPTPPAPAANPYAAGIDYSTTTDGHLTLILLNRVDTGTPTAATGGIRMFGDVGENMTLLREDNPLGAGDPRINNTTGRGIDLRTQGAGNVLINLTDGDPASGEPGNINTGTAPLRVGGSTDAIFAQAAGTGSVSVTFSPVSGAVAAITAGSGSAIATRSVSGAISVDTRGANLFATAGDSAIDARSTTGNLTIVTGAASQGRVRGVYAETGGTGAINLTVNGFVGPVTTNPLLDQVGIETKVGAGATTITLTTGGNNVTGGAGPAIRSTSASTSGVNVQNSTGQVIGGVDFSEVSAGGVVFNNSGASTNENLGRWIASGVSVFTNFVDTVSMGGGGANSIAADSSIDFGGGADTFAVSTRLNVGDADILFGAGADAFTVTGLLTTTGSTLDFGADNDVMAFSNRWVANATNVDFGVGTDILNGSAALAIEEQLTLSNLEAFNNSGVLYLGGNSGTATDRTVGDALVMTSGVFNATGSSRVVMDVLVGGGTQAGCATVTLADCLDFRGASTMGSTVLTVIDVNPNNAAQGGFDPVGITLVDVGGAGTTEAEHFVLDSASTGYVADELLGGVIARPGLFVYALRYDPANQRHVLIGAPQAEVLEYSMLSGAAHSIWHMTSQTVTDRQSDLRDGAEEGSVWLRSTGEYTQRESISKLALGESIAVETSYKLYAGTIMGGMDLVSGTTASGYDYAAGVQIGYVSSSFGLNESNTSGRMSGATGGGYASLWNDWFFVNGAVNLNGLSLDYEAPVLRLQTTTFVTSVGAAAEAGIRTPITASTFAEPLVNASWVRTSLEEISLFGGEVQPADAESLRGALGLRLGGTLAGQTVSATYFATGRAWYEFEGDSEGVVRNPGADLPFADEFNGAFGEMELGVNVFNASSTLSGFLTSGVKWNDGYSAVNLSLGMRMAW